VKLFVVPTRVFSTGYIGLWLILGLISLTPSITSGMM